MATQHQKAQFKLAIGLLLFILSFGASAIAARAIGAPALIIGISPALQALVFATAITAIYSTFALLLHYRQNPKSRSKSKKASIAPELSEPAAPKTRSASRPKIRRAAASAPAARQSRVAANPVSRADTSELQAEHQAPRAYQLLSPSSVASTREQTVSVPVAVVPATHPEPVDPYAVWQPMHINLSTLVSLLSELCLRYADEFWRGLYAIEKPLTRDESYQLEYGIMAKAQFIETLVSKSRNRDLRVLKNLPAHRLLKVIYQADKAPQDQPDCNDLDMPHKLGGVDKRVAADYLRALRNYINNFIVNLDFNKCYISRIGNKALAQLANFFQDDRQLLIKQELRLRFNHDVLRDRKLYQALDLDKVEVPAAFSRVARLAEKFEPVAFPSQRGILHSELVEYMMRPDFSLGEFIRLLRKEGNDINRTHLNGHTPLTYFLQYHNDLFRNTHIGRQKLKSDTFLVLMEFGANVNKVVADYRGYRENLGIPYLTIPLEIIIRNGLESYFRYLREYGMYPLPKPLSVLYDHLSSEFHQGIEISEYRAEVIKFLLEGGAELDYNFYRAMRYSKYSKDVKWALELNSFSRCYSTKFTAANFDPVAAKAQVLKFLTAVLEYYHQRHLAWERLNQRRELFKQAILDIDFPTVTKLYAEHIREPIKLGAELFQNYLITEARPRDIYLIEYLLTNGPAGKAILQFMLDNKFRPALNQDRNCESEWIKIPGLELDSILKLVDRDIYAAINDKTNDSKFYLENIWYLFYSDQAKALVRNVFNPGAHCSWQRVDSFPGYVPSTKLKHMMIANFVRAYYLNVNPKLEPHLNSLINEGFILNNKAQILKVVLNKLGKYTYHVGSSGPKYVKPENRLYVANLVKLFKQLVSSFDVAAVRQAMSFVEYTAKKEFETLTCSKNLVAPWLLCQDKYVRLVEQSLDGQAFTKAKQRYVDTFAIPVAQTLFGIKGPQHTDLGVLPKGPRLLIAMQCKPKLVPEQVWQEQIISKMHHAPRKPNSGAGVSPQQEAPSGKERARNRPNS